MKPTNNLNLRIYWIQVMSEYEFQHHPLIIQN